MKKLASLLVPVTFGFAATAGLFFAAPANFPFATEDTSHIFELERSISVEIPEQDSPANEQGVS